MVETPELGADDGTNIGPMPTQLGTQVQGSLLEKRWRLIEPLGLGTVGVVWLAHDTALDRRVAVKWMHEKHASNPTQVERFEREARVLAAQEHPHLVSVLAIGHHENRPFFVMRLLEGETLAERLHHRGGKLPLDRAVPLLVQVADALEHLHRQGVVHRDLKPSNVFVSNADHVTLLDLGSAFETGSELTQGGELVGALHYICPEQLKGEPLTPQSDVYSFGCLLYETLTGAPPFTGHAGDLIDQHQRAAPPVLSSPAGPLIAKALAKSPADRYGSIGELSAQLLTLVGKKPRPPIPQVKIKVPTGPRTFDAPESPTARTEVVSRPAREGDATLIAPSPFASEAREPSETKVPVQSPPDDATRRRRLEETRVAPVPESTATAAPSGNDARAGEVSDPGSLVALLRHDESVEAASPDEPSRPAPNLNDTRIDSAPAPKASPAARRPAARPAPKRPLEYPSISVSAQLARFDRRLFTAIAIGVVVLVAAAASFLSQPSTPPPPQLTSPNPDDEPTERTFVGTQRREKPKKSNKAKTTPIGRGEMRVVTTLNGQVVPSALWFDGDAKGDTPRLVTGVLPGDHVVRVQHKDLKPIEVVVPVASGRRFGDFIEIELLPRE